MKHTRLIHCRKMMACLTALGVAGSGGLHGQQPGPTSSPVSGYVEVFRPSTNQPVAERQARTAQRITARMVGGEAQLLRNFAGLYQEMWHNADGLSPQQVCDALGPKAGNLFVIAGTMANALYQIDPVGVGTMVHVPTGYTATIHDDGTVTVTGP